MKRTRVRRRWTELRLAWVVATAPLLAWSLFPSAAHARRERLDLRLVQIDLPGAPVAVLPVDLDHDGIGDLVIVVAYTEWDRIAIDESVEMDQVEGLVEMMTIVPALADRRELYVFLGDGHGGFRRLGEPLALDLSVVTVAAGPPAEPVIAIADEGLVGLRIDPPNGALRFEPLVAVRSVLGGTGALLPDLGLIHDLDGDGLVDVIVPRAEDLAIYRGSPSGIAAEPVDVVALPPRRQYQRDTRSRTYPLPIVEDVDGDRVPDLLFRHPTRGWERFWVARGRGGGRFAPLTAPLGDADDDGAEDNDAKDDDHWDDADETIAIGAAPPPAAAPDFEVIRFGDLDGDGRAEYVLSEDLSDNDAGWRKELKEAKQPPMRVRIYPSRADLGRDVEETTAFEAIGYAESGDEDEIRLPGGFQDLDGDGRRDLVTVTLDFSLLQAVRVLATRSLSIGLDFHVWCQGENGRFRAVAGLDLSGKFILRLDDLRLGELSQFAGDFDGDGRADFLQMGRGKTATIHRGQPGCRYPVAPDLALKLVEEPKNLALVRVGDFDGDGLADIRIVQPQRADRDGSTPRVRLDLYLSGEVE